MCLPSVTGNTFVKRGKEGVYARVLVRCALMSERAREGWAWRLRGGKGGRVGAVTLAEGVRVGGAVSVHSLGLPLTTWRKTLP